MFFLLSKKYIIHFFNQKICDETHETFEKLCQTSDRVERILNYTSLERLFLISILYKRDLFTFVITIWRKLVIRVILDRV